MEARGNSAFGKVKEIRRFPVKSLLGESLSRVMLDQRGLSGDRLWAVRTHEGKFGSGKTTRRFMRMNGLMHIEAGYDGDVPVVTMPDGNVYRGDDEKIHSVLSQFVGFPVTLAREEAVSHFDDGPVSLITTSSLRALSERLGDPVDPRRFRANFLVDTEAEGFVEDEWMNQVIRIGSSVTLKIISPITRCVMLNMTRPTLKKDDRILRMLARCHDAQFGVYARVEAGGCVESEQEVSFLS